MSKLSRREFLRYLVLAGAATAVSGCDFLSEEDVQTGSVVIVGAGLAGLTAAYELQKAGWTVTLLEARERVGGRVYTLHDGFTDDQYVEAGGEFIDIPHTQIQAYAEQFGLEMEEIGDGLDGYSSLVYFNRRRVFMEEIEEELGEEVVADIDRFWEAVDEVSDYLDDPAFPTANEEAAELDDYSVADGMDDLELNPTARALIENLIRSDYTAEVSDISLLKFAQDAATYWDVDEDEEEVYRIRGGNDQLTEALAQELGSAVKLNAPVTAVQHNAQSVTVTYAGGQVTADYAILAAPLPALRPVTFTPALPTALNNAIQQLHYGAATKVMLQYTERFWYDEDSNGNVFTDLPIGATWEATDQQDGEAGILTVFVGGKFDAQFRDLDEEGKVETAVAQLDEIFPGSRDLFHIGRAMSWAKEPYTGGSYSAYKPGQISAFWAALREGHQRLHFIGEHTDIYTAFMEGAIRSGQRVAHLLANSDS